MLDPLERENEIIDALNDIASRGLEFAVVGGYAVSAYRHRFSVDADIVIRKDELPKFEEALKARGYRKSLEKILENDYSSEYIRYEKTQPKAFFDLLIGAVGVRQTGASFGYDFVLQNSSVRSIEGSEKSVKARVADKELLIAMKLHSGRPRDLRDVAALAFSLDLARIRLMIFRGDVKVLKKNMVHLGELAGKQDFRDSFKGVFMEKHYRIDPTEIKKLASLAQEKPG
jgi:hypothetical protein